VLEHAFCGNFTAVLAKPKPFSLVDAITVGVDRIQRNFEPMCKEVKGGREANHGRHGEGRICEAFVQGMLEAPNHLARTVHDLYFEPRYEECRSRTFWSLSNAFTSDFKELDPIPQSRATAKLGEYAEVRFSQCSRLIGRIGHPPLPAKREFTDGRKISGFQIPSTQCLFYLLPR
jgi:hypothetical protein